jgi:hypothetical protein
MRKKSYLEILSITKSVLKVRINHYYIIKLDELFGKGIFASWVITGVLYGVLMYASVNFALQNMSPTGRHFSSLGVAGQLVYLVVVAFVNIKIFLSSHNINAFTWFFCYASTLVFMLLFWLLNLVNSEATADIYLEYHFVAYSPITYVVLVFIAVGLSCLDEGWQMTKRMARRFEDIQDNQMRKVEQKKIKVDPAF